jgi:hypothetical protein
MCGIRDIPDKDTFCIVIRGGHPLLHGHPWETGKKT